MVRGAIAGAALALGITGAQAEEAAMSANSILPGCRASMAVSPPSVTGSFCVGIIDGIIIMSEMRGGLLSPALCFDVPFSVGLGQTVRTVVAYIEARPARMGEDFHELTVEALRATWPCRP